MLLMPGVPCSCAVDEMPKRLEAVSLVGATCVGVTTADGAAKPERNGEEKSAESLCRFGECGRSYERLACVMSWPSVVGCAVSCSPSSISSLSSTCSADGR